VKNFTVHIFGIRESQVTTIREWAAGGADRGGQAAIWKLLCFKGYTGWSLATQTQEGAISCPYRTSVAGGL